MRRRTEQVQQLKPPARPRQTWLRWLFGISAVVVVALVVAGATLKLPPLALGVGLALYLTAAGLLCLRQGQPEREVYERWRDVMPCYLSVQDRDLRILETNELFRREFGAREGQRCYTAYKHRDSPCPNCPVLKTFEDGKTHSSEETVTTASGEEAHVLVTSMPLFDSEGRCASVVEMSTNITELKELQQERKAYENLFDLVPCYISVQDRKFRVVRTNKLFRDNFGEENGARCYKLYKGRDEVCPDCPVEKTFADGEVHSSEETVTTRTGQRAEVIVQSMPVRDDRGEITAVMEVSTNITEVKRLQSQLALMGLAVAGMAHRVKNILMGLEGGIFVVNTGFELEDQETVDDGWGMVERNVEKISRTVKDLLYCSKLREAEPQPDVSAAEIAREVHELFHTRAAQEGIALELEIDGEHRSALDPEGISKLLTNLTANALDACRFDPAYGDKAHRITLRCAQEENGDTVLEVEDNGVGIHEDVHHKVFESFFSTKGTEGTGLGLLVVQKVVDEHGGQITFTSSEGQGTRFRAVLPGGSRGAA